MAYGHKQLFPQSIAEYLRASRIEKTPVLDGFLGYAYAMSGNSEAHDILNELLEKSKRTYVPPYSIALIYTGLGMPDEALEWLRKALIEQSHWRGWFCLTPELDALRSDASFTELLQRSIEIFSISPSVSTPPGRRRFAYERHTESDGGAYCVRRVRLIQPTNLIGYSGLRFAHTKVAHTHTTLARSARNPCKRRSCKSVFHRKFARSTLRRRMRRARQTRVSCYRPALVRPSPAHSLQAWSALYQPAAFVERPLFLCPRAGPIETGAAQPGRARVCTE